MNSKSYKPLSFQDKAMKARLQKIEQKTKLPEFKPFKRSIYKKGMLLDIQA